MESGIRTSRRTGLWIGLSALLVIVVALAIRLLTNVQSLPSVRDEPLMHKPMADILEHGWTARTMLDYQEVKGPAFYWLYAACGEALGGEINSLRLVSVACFVLAVIPLLLMAVRVGVPGPWLPSIAALWALLPYNAFVGQLLFSEPSFVLIAAWMMWSFVWGFGGSSEQERRVWGPLVFGLLLAVLLHHRPQAVAFAGAAALTALARDGWRSWPWWLACALAGASRLPLWLRWGGLVTSDYQDLFTFGLRPQGLSYLLAVVLPWTAGLIWPAVTGASRRRGLLAVGVAGAVGLAIGLSAPADISSKVEYFHPGLQRNMTQAEYAGVVATGLRAASPSPSMQRIGLALLAMAGAASVGAMGVLAHRRSAASADGQVMRLAFWTIAAGLPLYAITSGPLYDRYLMIWMLLMPIVWWSLLPRWLLMVQAAGLAGMAAWQCAEYLF